MTRLVWTLALAVGCATATEAPTPSTELVSLGDARLYRRMSLDLRGALPSIVELDELEAGSALGDLRDGLFDDPRFEARLVDLLGQAWRTQVDEFLVRYEEYPQLAGDPTLEYPFERAVGEEPLRLLARVAADKAPWSTIVTADWTMANEVTGPLWPVDYPAGESGWRVVHYTDARPAAGVLSTNGLWWRYFSTVSNYNRGRVAAITRLLLCEDYSGRAVTLSGGDPDLGLEDNLRQNPACLGCHASLDPAATALFGFWPANEYNLVELANYHPEREKLGPDLLGVEPAWFGQPLDGLAHLGRLVADDPRFARCTAETAASLLWRRPVSSADNLELEALTAAFAADDRFDRVLAAVTDGERYRAGGYGSAASADTRSGELVVRLLDAPLLASVLEDLTGFLWTYEGFEQLRNDTWGHRLLGGGVDGFYATRSQSTPGLTWLLVAQRATEAAAGHAVQVELVEGGAAQLFESISLTDRPGDARFDSELSRLHRRLYGDRADAAWLAEVGALWTDLAAARADAADADAADAWKGTVSALLQDPLFVTY